MNDEPIDVAALREALGWTQQQFADHFAADRSTISKWEREAPTKGPALVLLRQLMDTLPRSLSPVASQGAEAGPVRQDPIPAGPADISSAHARTGPSDLRCAGAPDDRRAPVGASGAPHAEAAE